MKLHLKLFSKNWTPVGGKTIITSDSVPSVGDLLKFKEIHYIVYLRTYDIVETSMNSVPRSDIYIFAKEGAPEDRGWILQDVKVIPKGISKIGGVEFDCESGFNSDIN